jgi:Predicted sugar kinase
VARAKAKAAIDPFEAARVIYDTLKPLDADTRHRVMVSALSLLGMDAATVGPSALDPSAPATPPTPAQPHSSSSRPVSPVELVQQKQPSTNAQRLAVFAYHRERNEGKGRFSRADLRDYFAKARLVPPQNYDRDFMTAVDLGYIYEDGSESYLTSKGLEAVEQGFGGKGTPWGAKSTSKRPAKKKASKKSKRSQ